MEEPARKPIRVTVSFDPQEPEEIKEIIHMLKYQDYSSNIWDALQEIRSVLKWEDGVTEKEEERLEKIREILSEGYDEW